ncbi:hypothetical protein GW17_00025602 [Ensete ventricosum]|nr:hypothetical protein GW17_00025602 [Ensete ventricosum]
MAWPPARGRPTATKASPQGRQVVARRGHACGQKRRLQGLPLIASRGSARPRPVCRGEAPVEVPPAGVEPAVSGQGNCRLCRGSNDDDSAMRVIEGLEHPFKKRIILTLRI